MSRCHDFFHINYVLYLYQLITKTFLQKHSYKNILTKTFLRKHSYENILTKTFLRIRFVRMYLMFIYIFIIIIILL